MNLKHVNSGGEQSIVRSDCPLQLDERYHLTDSAFTALKLWQVRGGEAITVVDNHGHWFRARVVNIVDDAVEIIPFETIIAPESALRICVFQAIPAKERFEMIVQKLTEIGVADIVPFVCEHSITVAERDAVQKKSHRWPDVILRAAKQCRRGMLPHLYEPCSWNEVLNNLTAVEAKVILTEKGSQWSFVEGVGNTKVGSIAIIIGPEGGFSDVEIGAAQDCGALPVTLGSRILRTETAAIVAAALAQHIAGDYA